MTTPSIRIADDVTMPQLGLGLWQVTDEGVCVAAVRAALEVGYRHFDSALSSIGTKRSSGVLSVSLATTARTYSSRPR
jgi:hypothetical protein